MKIAGDVLAQEDIITKPDRLKRYASIIQNQTAHLQNQVEKLLKSASAENKRLPIDKQNYQSGLAHRTGAQQTSAAD